MKKGTLNFLGRKNQSLFDTTVKFKEMDNVELVISSSAVHEPGTAKVRSRPTVKHHISSSDGLHGFAVPTPTVPVLPTFNGLQTNGSVSGDELSIGSSMSVPDLVEGEIFVPPPPSMAPPPPPTQFLPPPTEFMGELDDADLAALQPPSMPPPKPPSLAPSLEDEDLTFLKPPPMAPPKPPSTCSSASTSSLPISTPPTKTQKIPPAKPIRLSSIPSLDGPPQSPAPSPSVQAPTRSSFNPQNAAKIYNVPKASIIGGLVDHDTRPKNILLLEDSGSVKSTPVPIQVNGKASSLAPPSKPVCGNGSEAQLEKDPQAFKNLQANLPLQIFKSQPKEEAKTEMVSTQQEINKPVQSPPEVSPKLQKESIPQVNHKGSQVKLEESLNQNHKFSPLLDRKLRNLKGSETTGAREGPAVSPLALLMAAKEREKHRSSLSRQNSARNEQSSASIQPSDSSPNSFVVTPRPTSCSSLTPQGIIEESQKSVVPLEPTLTAQAPGQPRSPALVRGEAESAKPTVSGMSTGSSPAASSIAVEKQSAERGPSPSKCAPYEGNGEEPSMPLLPPPPEFANSAYLDEIMESPPTTPAPDPPVKKAPSPTASPVSPVKGPSLPPKPKLPAPPAPPKLPPLKTDVKPKPPPQTKSSVPLTQPPSSLSASQATLLSILQKKMLEMDHKIAPMKETSSEDWGSPLSDEETKVPVLPKATPQNKNYTLPSKTPSLDMRELETKVAKKYQDMSSSKGTTSNGPQSKHQYGMTFTVRPGTKQPITLVSKGDSS